MTKRSVVNQFLNFKNEKEAAIECQLCFEIKYFRHRIERRK